MNEDLPLSAETVIEAAKRAAEILSGMGYHGPYGSVHLLDLNLQTNTVTAIYHNLVAWQISELDPRWQFHPKGGATPDLTDASGQQGIQIKATSNAKIKGNKVSRNEGYYVAIRYSRDPERGPTAIKVDEILMGELREDDWERIEGTQWAILKPEAQKRLKRVYP